MGNCLFHFGNPYATATLENTPEYSLEGRRCQVKILRVLDGDTVDIALYHPGLQTTYRHRVRLFGIDTPEKRPRKDQPNREQEMAAAARSSDALRHRLEAIQNLPEALFHSTDKYGRVMCTFYAPDHPEKSINDWMIAEGYAYAYDGQTKKPFSEP